MVFGLFAKKIVCWQCDRKVKRTSSTFRRGMRFCSTECVEAFLEQNRLAPPPDVAPDRYVEHARIELGHAFTELAGLVRAAGGTVRVSIDVLGGAIGGALAAQNLEEMKDRLYRFHDHSLQSLRYLYALGRHDVIDFLECVDLEEIGDMSNAGAGPAQNARIRRLTEPVVAALATHLQSFGTA